MRALREILQEIALLGLWRSKFFDKAAFYGGTALRLLYGLDRFSEDLDFSLLAPTPTFELARYGESLRDELAAFGFDVRFEARQVRTERAVQSAFLKADTWQQMLVIESSDSALLDLPRGQVLKIKLEVDTNPPAGFATTSRCLTAARSSSSAATAICWSRETESISSCGTHRRSTMSGKRRSDKGTLALNGKTTREGGFAVVVMRL